MLFLLFGFLSAFISHLQFQKCFMIEHIILFLFLMKGLVKHYCVSSHLMSAGGAHEHSRKDEAGVGFHQAASLLYTAVTSGEGHPPHQHETGAQETAGGDPGDEVSAIMAFHVS